MDGRELFKFAVTKLPECARALCAETGTSIESIDWFLAHQANARINEYVREHLGVPPEKLPSNIDRFGNTSAGTLPILIDEQTRAGKLKRGQLCMLLALGAGVHWGCALSASSAPVSRKSHRRGAAVRSRLSRADGRRSMRTGPGCATVDAA